MDNRAQQEKRYLVRTADGFLVSVPESGMEGWQRGQQEAERGAYRPQPQEVGRMRSLLEALAGQAPSKQE